MGSVQKTWWGFAHEKPLACAKGFGQGSELPGDNHAKVDEADVIPAVADAQTTRIEDADAHVVATRGRVCGADPTVGQQAFSCGEGVDNEEGGDDARRWDFFVGPEQLELLCEGIAEGAFDGDAEGTLLRGVFTLRPVLLVVP